MALNAGEVQSGGTVRDKDGRLVVVVVARVGASEVNSGGVTRDADGRMVVVFD
jgi:hypothetical protein